MKHDKCIGVAYFYSTYLRFFFFFAVLIYTPLISCHSYINILYVVCSRLYSPAQPLGYDQV